MKEMCKTSYKELIWLQNAVRLRRENERYTRERLPASQKYYDIACRGVWPAECALVGFRLQYEQEDLDSFVPM